MGSSTSPISLNSWFLREQGYRAVLGYREQRRDAFLRLLNAKGWNVLVSLLLGLHIRDIDCAFKLYDTALVRVFDVTSEGAMINTEMLTKLTKLGIPYVQTPVHHYPRVHGKATGANLRVIANAFRELFRLRYALVRRDSAGRASAIMLKAQTGWRGGCSRRYR